LPSYPASPATPSLIPAKWKNLLYVQPLELWLTSPWPVGFYCRDARLSRAASVQQTRAHSPRRTHRGLQPHLGGDQLLHRQRQWRSKHRPVWWRWKPDVLRRHAG
jgi:hypothetical protein